MYDITLKGGDHMGGINPGERLKFRVGEHVCPHGLGTPHDCNELVRPLDGVNLVCGIQGDGGPPCPFDPTLILLKDIADGHHSHETDGLPPLDK